MFSHNRRRFVSGAVLTGLLGVAGTRSTPADSEQRANSRSMVNALDFGAKGDGVSGDSAAIQRAIDTMSAGGGGIVSLPAGVFRLDTPLIVQKDTALLGVYQGPISHAGVRDKGTARPDRGTVLITSLGAGMEDGDPLIMVGENSTLAGVAIYYPEQDPAKTPVPYPWSISLVDNNATVREVELINSYKGILAVGCARHLIRDVTGQPLRNGIFVDAIYDIGRIENVHWNPWWSESQPVADFQYRHGEAFVFGRSDWEYVFNTFSFGYRYGYRFIRTSTGICNGNFLGIGADGSWNAVGVDECDIYGLQITNGEFVSMSKAGPATFPDVKARQVIVSKANYGVIRFVNCAFWGPSFQTAQIQGTGNVSFSDCTFAESSAQNPTIVAQSGSLQVANSEFRNGGVPIELQAGVTAATIVGNIIHGTGQIVNESHADVQIGLNSRCM